MGLALNCKIRTDSVFARKNYFYPDLPKGYQISQFDEPLCEHGSVEFFLDNELKKVSITRAHMEEDAGKSIHQGDATLVNYNRGGVPLLEIVSGPDLRSPAEAAAYARTVRNILRYLDVCDGNLEEGSMRCDCNVSVRPAGEKKLGTKVEIKNINSFRFVEKALEYEIQRQMDCLASGEPIHQETRLFDPDKSRTVMMRSKEEAHDYRYFPDPDLLHVHLTESYIEQQETLLPELPLAKAKRFQQEYKLPAYDAFILTNERELAVYFEKVTHVCGNAKSASNWIMTELLRELNEAKKEITQCPIPAEHLGKMISLIDKNVISGKIAKTVFSEMWNGGGEPEKIVKEKNLVQITDTAAIEKMVDEVIAANPQQLEQYRGGKDKLFGYFVGQAMKVSKGQASPELLNQILIKKLKG
jgi:aspartyl-tRNA(Asn)/glutamyl-tRNA(Gln) amidotransferase subunit B